MSWLFSRALVEEYSGACSTGGKRFAQLSVMLTPRPFLRNDKPIKSWRRSQFGLTSKLLTDSHGAALLTWFQGDFLARTSAQLGREKALMAPAAVSGHIWPESWVKFDPVTSSWRTRQCSFLEGLDVYLETWPRWGLMQDGACSALSTPELPTNGSESGFWPTPTANAANGPGHSGWQAGMNLQTAVQLSLQKFPIPTASLSGSNRSASPGAKRRPGLTQIAQSSEKFPTPKRRDFKASGGAARHTPDLPGFIGGSLNPAWDEWLMGWPIGWTELKPLAMAKFLLWPQWHGKSSLPSDAQKQQIFRPEDFQLSSED